MLRDSRSEGGGAVGSIGRAEGTESRLCGRGRGVQQVAEVATRRLCGGRDGGSCACAGVIALLVEFGQITRLRVARDGCMTLLVNSVTLEALAGPVLATDPKSLCDGSETASTGHCEARNVSIFMIAVGFRSRCAGVR